MVQDFTQHPYLCANTSHYSQNISHSGFFFIAFAAGVDQKSPVNATVLSIIDVWGVEQSINTAAVLTAVSRMGDQDTLNLLPPAAIMWSPTI